VPGSELVEVEILELRADVQGLGTGPVLLLRERSGTRVLPIYIGVVEARSIKLAMDRIEPPRPLTHDLAVQLVQALGATLVHVVVNEVRQRVFYAIVELAGADGGRRSVESRPSDAVALAVRVGAPILVERDVLDEHGVDETPTDEAVVDEFKRFLDVINPDDFAPESGPGS
jgi:uncharacterized protein